MAEPHRQPLTAAVARYRLLATVVGTALLLMVFVAMPLKYFAAQPLGVEIIGPLHGFLYILYLVTVIDLSRHVRLRPLQVVAMVTAGLVPFLTFVVERRVVQSLASRMAQTDAAASGT
jgi:integral membrane protein